MATDTQEKDVTLIELVANQDLIDLGETDETAERKRLAVLVDKELIKAQLAADDGNYENYMLLFKLCWHKHNNDVTIPKYYKNERLVASSPLTDEAWTSTAS